MDQYRDWKRLLSLSQAVQSRECKQTWLQTIPRNGWPLGRWVGCGVSVRTKWTWSSPQQLCTWAMSRLLWKPWACRCGACGSKQLEEIVRHHLTIKLWTWRDFAPKFQDLVQHVSHISLYVECIQPGVSSECWQERHGRLHRWMDRQGPKTVSNGSG